MDNGYSNGGGHPAFRNRVNQGQGYYLGQNPVFQLIHNESRPMSSAAMHRVDQIPRTGASMADRVRDAGTYPGRDGDRKEREAEEKEAAGESGKKILSHEATTDRYRQFVLNMDAETAKRDEKIRKQKRKRMKQQEESSSDDSDDDDDDSDDDYEMEPASPLKHNKKGKNKATANLAFGAANVAAMMPPSYADKKKKKKATAKVSKATQHIPYLV